MNMFLFAVASFTATAGIFVWFDGGNPTLMFLIAAVFLVGGAIVEALEKKKS